MEQLILFLFKHWYLVILVLTFLYQLSNKLKKDASKGNARGRKMQGMPSFGERPDPTYKPARVPQRQQQPNMASTQPSRPQGGYVDSSAPQASMQTHMRKESPFGAPATTDEAGSAPLIGAAIQPTQQQLVQGIIWAEILGPPRSKKPYRR